MAYGRPHAVAACVAAADDEDVLALCVYWRSVELAGQVAVLPFKKFKREVDAAEFASRDPQVARGWRSDGDDDRVVAAGQPFG